MSVILGCITIGAGKEVAEIAGQLRPRLGQAGGGGGPHYASRYSGIRVADLISDSKETTKLSRSTILPGALTISFKKKSSDQFPEALIYISNQRYYIK